MERVLRRVKSSSSFACLCSLAAILVQETNPMTGAVSAAAPARRSRN